MRLTHEQQQTAAELWPLARRVARRAWRDPDAESVAAEALCIAVAAWDPARLPLAAWVAWRVRAAVIDAWRRAGYEPPPAPVGRTAAPEPAPPLWEVLPPEEVAAVEAFTAEPGDRDRAVRAAAKFLGIKREVVAARIKRAEDRLCGAT